jgi:CRP-like cAMP-binding protein
VETARKETLLNRLREIPLFDALSADQLDRLAGAAAIHTVRSRETLYEQGDPARSCFAILAGTLRFSVRLGKQKATSGLASADDLFGLESLQPNGRRPETAIAGATAEVAEIGSGLLKELVLENPRFQFGLLNYVVMKLQEKSSHAVQTGHYDAEQRLASYLIENCGDRPLRGCRQGVVVSQADLADYLALTPETLCRKVSKFRKLGWIGGRGNDYVIRKPAALQQLLEQ